MTNELSPLDIDARDAAMSFITGDLEKKLTAKAKLLDNKKAKGKKREEAGKAQLAYFKKLHGFDTDAAAADLMTRVFSGEDAAAEERHGSKELKYITLIMTDPKKAKEAYIGRFNYLFKDVKEPKEAAKKYASPSDIQRNVIGGYSILDEYIRDNEDVAKEVSETYSALKLAKSRVPLSRIVKLAILYNSTKYKEKGKDGKEVDKSEIEDKMGCTIGDVIKALMPTMDGKDLEDAVKAVKSFNASELLELSYEETSYIGGMKVALKDKDKNTAGYLAMKTLFDQKYSAEAPKMIK